MAREATRKQNSDEMFTDQFWDRPAPKTDGDQTPDAIYLAIGMALSQWEILETYFARLFSAFLGDQPNGAGRIYGSIGTSHGRREAIKFAAEVYFEINHVPQDKRRMLNKLIKGLQAARRYRSRDSTCN